MVDQNIRFCWAKLIFQRFFETPIANLKSKFSNSTDENYLWKQLIFQISDPKKHLEYEFHSNSREFNILIRYIKFVILHFEILATDS